MFSGALAAMSHDMKRDRPGEDAIKSVTKNGHWGRTGKDGMKIVTKDSRLGGATNFLRD